MKSAKLLCIGCAFAGAASVAQAQTPAALYSFEDVYRMALAGPVAQAPGAFALAAPSDSVVRVAPVADTTVRAAEVEEAPVTELHFTVDPLPGPQVWLLLLAGIAAAGWVAHRRLAQL